MKFDLWHRIAAFATSTPWRSAVTRYAIMVVAIVSVAVILPLTGLEENAGFVVFAVMIACAWYLGIGPAILIPFTLVLTIKFRAVGWAPQLVLTPKEWFDLIIITGFTSAVGISGTLRRRSLAIAKNQAQLLLLQDRRKDEFLATLAHELRNPLAPIRTGLEVLRLLASAPPNPAAIQQIHQMMQRQVDHMVRLIDDLLDVSRINTGKIEMRRELVALSEVVGDAVDASRPHIDAAGHELSLNLPAQTVMIDVDRARISQVLTNLLNNAAKFMQSGGHIWLDGKVEGNQVEIRVRDRGMGIAPDVLPRIFDLFVQADNILTRSQGGLGIGLSLSRTLVQLHGGSIDAFSEGLGKGSEFVLCLPLPVQGSSDPQAAGSHAPGTVARRILIVDDNQDAATSLALVLAAQGHVCDTAFESTAALQRAIAFRPDVFLLDIGMPGMSGFELATQLRATADFKTSVLIAVTGWGQHDDRRKCLDAGFDQHLVKPVRAADLHQVLDSLGTDKS